MKLNERLQRADGGIERVINATQRAGTQRVYNLEVDGEHVYYVGRGGLLVHNVYTKVIETPTDFARRVGKEGEKAADIVKNSSRIDSISGKAAFRIPDELTETTLTEVKNVGYQHFSTQLQDSLHYSIMTGREMILKVRHNTKLSKDLQRAVDSGYITLIRMPKK